MQTSQQKIRPDVITLMMLLGHESLPTMDRERFARVIDRDDSEQITYAERVRQRIQARRDKIIATLRAANRALECSVIARRTDERYEVILKTLRSLQADGLVARRCQTGVLMWSLSNAA